MPQSWRTWGPWLHHTYVLLAQLLRHPTSLLPWRHRSVQTSLERPRPRVVGIDLSVLDRGKESTKGRAASVTVERDGGRREVGTSNHLGRWVQIGAVMIRIPGWQRTPTGVW